MRSFRPKIDHSIRKKIFEVKRTIIYVVNKQLQLTIKRPEFPQNTLYIRDRVVKNYWIQQSYFGDFEFHTGLRLESRRNIAVGNQNCNKLFARILAWAIKIKISYRAEMVSAFDEIFLWIVHARTREKSLLQNWKVETPRRNEFHMVWRQLIGIFSFFNPTVISSYREPVEGWVDNVYGPTGALVGCGAGLIRTLNIDESCTAELVPVDLTVNALIATAWDIANNKWANEYYIAINRITKIYCEEKQNKNVKVSSLKSTNSSAKWFFSSEDDSSRRIVKFIRRTGLSLQYVCPSARGDALDFFLLWFYRSKIPVKLPSTLTYFLVNGVGRFYCRLFWNLFYYLERGILQNYDHGSTIAAYLLLFSGTRQPIHRSTIITPRGAKASRGEGTWISRSSTARECPAAGVFGATASYQRRAISCTTF